MISFNLKPTHKAIADYYAGLEELAQLDLFGEGAVAPAFAALLRYCARSSDWTLAEQYVMKRGGRSIRVDGALLDPFKLLYGVWEAKDSDDDLETRGRQEVPERLPPGQHPLPGARSAPSSSRTAYGSSTPTSRSRRPWSRLRALLRLPAARLRAVGGGRGRVQKRRAQTGPGLLDLIEAERQQNKQFIAAFQDFAEPLPGDGQPQSLRPGRGGDAHPASAHRAHLSQGVQQPRLCGAQHHRPRDRNASSRR